MNIKLKSALLAGVMAMSTASVPAFAETAETAQPPFTVVSIPCPEGEKYFRESYQDFDHLTARYADTKTPIALSNYYDGTMFATVPSENKDRKIEAFVAEEKTFSDETDDFEFYYLKRLSSKGVISGDDKGNALPANNITRAEATAMIMRFLGLDSSAGTDSGFDDVAKDAWYAEVVTAARKFGIVSGDSATEFNPQRNVSREELTAMTARGIWYAGLAEENKNATKADLEGFDITDADDISPWAYSAYNTMGYHNILDYDYIDNGEDKEPTDINDAKPKTAATRANAATLLVSAIEDYQNYPSQYAVEYGFDKEMPVIDGSTSTYPFTQAIYTNLFSNGFNHPSKPAKHSKSHASYERLINGEVDAIIASVYPAEDIIEEAKNKGVELELIPIAYDAMIFFTNKDNSIEGLTSQQITDIYVDDKYDNWKDLGGPDAKLYPYCRNNDSGSHAQMQRHFLNGKEINERIRRETTSVAMSDVLTDVIGSQTEDPVGYGLGYSIYYYFQNMDMIIDNKTYLKLLSIDGVFPTDETIADGSYPLSNNTYVVINKNSPENSKARRFADFMLSPMGQLCVEQAGFGPLHDYSYKFDLDGEGGDYYWSVDSYDERIIDVSYGFTPETREDGTKTDSGMGKCSFVINGLREGTSDLKLSYKQSLGEEPAVTLKTVNYKFSVAKDGKVTLLESSESAQ